MAACHSKRAVEGNKAATMSAREAEEVSVGNLLPCGCRAHFGHDGGAKLFVDGKSVYCNPAPLNPARPDRAQVPVSLTKGTHEILVAFDLDEMRGWGIHLNFSMPEKQRFGAGGVFPEGVSVD